MLAGARLHMVLDVPIARWVSVRKKEGHALLWGRDQTSRSLNDGYSLDQRPSVITTKCGSKNLLNSKFKSNNHFPEHHMIVPKKVKCLCCDCSGVFTWRLCHSHSLILPASSPTRASTLCKGKSDGLSWLQPIPFLLTFLCALLLFSKWCVRAG